MSESGRVPKDMAVLRLSKAILRDLRRRRIDIYTARASWDGYGSLNPICIITDWRWWIPNIVNYAGSYAHYTFSS